MVRIATPTRNQLTKKAPKIQRLELIDPRWTPSIPSPPVRGLGEGVNEEEALTSRLSLPLRRILLLPRINLLRRRPRTRLLTRLRTSLCLIRATLLCRFPIPLIPEIRHIPPRPLKMKSRRRHQFLQPELATHRALALRPLAEFLNNLRAFTAPATLVFVNRHD